MVRGANGIVFYSWFDILRNDDMSFTEQWGHLCDVATELDKFAPVLLSDAGAAPAAAVSKKGGGSAPWLRTRARFGDERGDYYYLFAANDGDGSGEVVFSLGDSVKISGNVEVVSESPTRTITPADDRSFNDHSKALDVVIYRLATKK